MAVLIPLIAVVWAAGAAWIKACDYVDTRRSQLHRQRAHQAMSSVREQT